jgi:hypothetical protein
MKQCNTVKSALLALLLAELLKLAHRLLLTRVSNQAYPVNPRLFALSLAINHEYDSAGTVLELDETQLHLGSSGCLVPAVFGELDLLCRRLAVSFVKAKNVRAIGV